MPIVGYGLNKINIERKGPVKGKVEIKNNVSIKNVEEKDLAFGGTKQKGLKFTFEFVSKYEPKLGEIALFGDILFTEKPDKVKEIQKEWKKGKKVSREVMAQIMNTILARCHITAIGLSQDVSLPPPIPLPKVKASEGDKRYIG